MESDDKKYRRIYTNPVPEFSWKDAILKAFDLKMNQKKEPTVEDMEKMLALLNVGESASFPDYGVYFNKRHDPSTYPESKIRLGESLRKISRAKSIISPEYYKYFSR